MFRSTLLFAATVAAALFVAPATSEAAFVLKLESGAGTALIDLDAIALGGTLNLSGGAGADAYSAAAATKTSAGGVTTVSFTNLVFGDYTILANIGQTNAPGAQVGNGGWLSLSGITIIRGSSAASDLKISLTATDYALPDPQKFMTSNFTFQALGAITPFTAALTSSYDATNTQFGTPALTTASMNLNVPADSPGSAPIVTFLPGTSGTYSLTNTISINGLGIGEAVTQGTVSTSVLAPAPAGVIMLATALPFVGLLRRRLRKCETATAV